MHKLLLIPVVALIGVVAINSPASAQFGGWQPNGSGGFNGTGNNMGSGWQSNGSGGMNGTGNNMGRHCQSNGSGGMNCN
jgi:hypothetical protein